MDLKVVVSFYCSDHDLYVIRVNSKSEILKKIKNKDLFAIISGQIDSGMICFQKGGYKCNKFFLDFERLAKTFLKINMCEVIKVEIRFYDLFNDLTVGGDEVWE